MTMLSGLFLLASPALVFSVQEQSGRAMDGSLMDFIPADSSMVIWISPQALARPVTAGVVLAREMTSWRTLAKN
jgi:hypothetical protein